MIYILLSGYAFENYDKTIYQLVINFFYPFVLRFSQTVMYIEVSYTQNLFILEFLELMCSQKHPEFPCVTEPVFHRTHTLGKPWPRWSS